MARPIAGRPRYPTPPEPGTIPTRITRELLVVLGQEPDGRTLLGHAQPDELTAAAIYAGVGTGPRSVAEHTAALERRRPQPVLP